MRRLILLAVVFSLAWLPAEAFSDPVSGFARSGFLDPPDSARPHAWWHWMNGNVTREGITADLEAMKRVGLGGAQIFHVAEGIPEGKRPVPQPRVVGNDGARVSRGGSPRPGALRAQLRRVVIERRSVGQTRASDDGRRDE